MSGYTTVGVHVTNGYGVGGISQVSLYGIGGTNEGRIVTFGGEFPIESDDDVIGAIGISGGSPEEDVTVAEASREAFEA